MGPTARFFLAAAVCQFGNGWLHWPSISSESRSWMDGIRATAGSEIAAEEEQAAPPDKIAPLRSPRLTFLYLDREVGEVFSRWPPGPLDYAVLLRNLAAVQPKTLVLYDPLRWNDESVESRALRRQLELLNVVQGCVLDAQPLVPLEGVDFLTPIFNVEGDIGKVPVFEGVSQLAATKDLHDCVNGFTGIDFGAGPQVKNGVVVFPLLARWRDRIYPSLVLQTVLIDLQMKFDAVAVRLGESITVGDVVIPIDDAGRFGFPVDVRALLVRSPADVLLPLDDSERPSEDFVCQDVVMIGNTEVSAIDLGNTTGKVALSELAAMAVTAVQAGKMLQPPSDPDPDPVPEFETKPWYDGILNLPWWSCLLGAALAAVVSSWIVGGRAGAGVWLYFLMASVLGAAALVSLGFAAAAEAFAGLSSAALVGHLLPGREKAGPLDTK